MKYDSWIYRISYTVGIFFAFNLIKGESKCPGTHLNTGTC